MGRGFLGFLDGNVVPGSIKHLDPGTRLTWQNRAERPKVHMTLTWGLTFYAHTVKKRHYTLIIKLVIYIVIYIYIYFNEIYIYINKCIHLKKMLI